jgi:hypothetical protein
MAGGIVVASLGPDARGLQALLTQVVIEPDAVSDCWKKLRAGYTFEVVLVRPLDDRDVPVFDAQSVELDVVNFCHLAGEAGYDRERAARAFWACCRSGPIVVRLQRCTVGSNCAMKPSNGRASDDHKLLPVDALLKADFSKMTPRAREILEAVQKKVRAMR